MWRTYATILAAGMIAAASAGLAPKLKLKPADVTDLFSFSSQNSPATDLVDEQGALRRLPARRNAARAGAGDRPKVAVRSPASPQPSPETHDRGPEGRF